MSLNKVTLSSPGGDETKNKKISLNIALCVEATLHMLMIKQDSEINTNITYKAKQSNTTESFLYLTHTCSFPNKHHLSNCLFISYMFRKEICATLIRQICLFKVFLCSKVEREKNNPSREVLVWGRVTGKKIKKEGRKKEKKKKR